MCSNSWGWPPDGDVAPGNESAGGQQQGREAADDGQQDPAVEAAVTQVMKLLMIRLTREATFTMLRFWLEWVARHLLPTGHPMGGQGQAGWQNSDALPDRFGAEQQVQ